MQRWQQKGVEVPRENHEAQCEQTETVLRVVQLLDTAFERAGFRLSG